MKHLMRFVFVFLSIIIVLGPAAAAEDSIPPELKELRDSYAGVLEEGALSNCDERLVPIFDIETLEFMKFIETNFQNKSSTTSLTNIAIARYSQYKNTLKNYAARLVPKYSTVENIEQYEEEYGAYRVCMEIMDSYIKLAKEHMIRNIRNNSAQRQTTILLEKFKAINSKLRDLNMEIAEMYSFFMALKNKLPGFLKECL